MGFDTKGILSRLGIWKSDTPLALNGGSREPVEGKNQLGKHEDQVNFQKRLEIRGVEQIPQAFQSLFEDSRCNQNVLSFEAGYSLPP